MIRKATVNDAGRVAEIHVFGWRSAYRNFIADSHLFGEMLVEKRISAFRKAMEKETEDTYVNEEDGLIKGFITIGKCRNPDKPDAFELWGIYIEPLMKRQGIGARLVNFCEEQAKLQGYKENVIWVFCKNENARRFYERMGYRPDGKEEHIEYFKEYEMRYVKDISDARGKVPLA